MASETRDHELHWDVYVTPGIPVATHDLPPGRHQRVFSPISATSFRMGLWHGMYCLGCNWLLFILLFPLGMMNIVTMVLLTALVFAEKCFPLGTYIARCAALALILYGALVIMVQS